MVPVLLQGISGGSHSTIPCPCLQGRLLARPQGVLPQPGRLLQGVKVHAEGLPGGLVLLVSSRDSPLYLADKVPDCVQNLPGHAPVIACQSLKPRRVYCQSLREVCRDLVHGFLGGQVDTAGGIPGLIPFHQFCAAAGLFRQSVHRVVPVLPVGLRCDLLEPVGELAAANEKIAEQVVDAYKKIENTVVGGYTKIEDAFIDHYLTKDGETVEEAKARLKGEHNT